MTDQLLTYAQAGERLTISERAVQRLVKLGKLPMVAPSEGTRRIKASACDAYIDSLKPINGDNLDAGQADTEPQPNEGKVWPQSSNGAIPRTGSRATAMRAAKALKDRLGGI
ncbi:MAG: hypothetical protein U1F68_14825 [Gammaproteobacteria bacterium]